MNAPARPFIPVNTPDIGPRERELVAQCLAEGWVSSEGPWIDRFEAACASRFGRRHAIAVTNGSAALDAAVAALRLGPGDEVIVPTFTIISCAAAVVRAGAKPLANDSQSRQQSSHKMVIVLSLSLTCLSQKSRADQNDKPCSRAAYTPSHSTTCPEQ